MISILIPTFNRPSSVIANTITSILLDPSSFGLISEIILIDQNTQALELDVDFKDLKYSRMQAGQEVQQPDLEHPRLIHITGLSPSVTRAKNFGARYARGSILVFFDDDVTVQSGTLSKYYEVFSNHPEITYLGGREILDSRLKGEARWKKALRRLVQSRDPNEARYQVEGTYVGRIKSNSFMIKNFDVITEKLIKIDGARGCNWACRASAFRTAGGFDEHYQGTALREETDLYLRLNALPGGGGFYCAEASVIHHRQAGGCDNLSDSLRSLKSKFDNEVYFQVKNFSKVSRFYFLMRTAPLMLSSLKESKGLSIFIWLRAWFLIHR